MLVFAAIVAGAAILLVAGIVAANPAHERMLAPSVRLPAKVRAGIWQAQRRGGFGFSGRHRVRPQPVAIAAHRVVAAPPAQRPDSAGSPPAGGQQAAPPSAVAVAVPAGKNVAEGTQEQPVEGSSPPPSPVVEPDPSPVVTPPVEAPAPAPVPAPSPVPVQPPPAPVPATPEPATPEPTTPPPAVTAPLLVADFENGLSGWNIAGVGDVVPTVADDIVRDGERSSAVVLSGEQGRSELILGGNGSASLDGTVQFQEGDEYWYGFSFYIQSMVYGRPGAHNLIMQFKGSDSGSPNFGLQLWDYAGDAGQYRSNPKGLWSAGAGMGGDRFLALAPEQQWHDVAIHFKVSRVGAGFYQVYLDGALVDARADVSILPPAAGYGYIKNGLYRNGPEIPGTSELRLDAAKLGETLASVLP